VFPEAQPREWEVAWVFTLEYRLACCPGKQVRDNGVCAPKKMRDQARDDKQCLDTSLQLVR